MVGSDFRCLATPLAVRAEMVVGTLAEVMGISCLEKKRKSRTKGIRRWSPLMYILPRCWSHLSPITWAKRLVLIPFNIIFSFDLDPYTYSPPKGLES